MNIAKHDCMQVYKLTAYSLCQIYDVLTREEIQHVMCKINFEAKFVLGEAVQHPDGLAVIGIFFSVTPK